MATIKRFLVLVLGLLSVFSVGCVENTFMTAPEAETQQLELAPWIEQDIFIEMFPEISEYQFGNNLTFFVSGDVTPVVDVRSENGVLAVIAHAIEMRSEPNSNRRIWKVTVAFVVRTVGEGKITATLRNSRSKGSSFSVHVGAYSGKG